MNDSLAIPALTEDLARVLIDADTINRRVDELARQISADYKGSEGTLILVGVLKGSFIFIADLARKLNVDHVVDFIALSSYPAARITLYDPKKPYNFGTGPGSNPLDIGPLDAAEIAYRPHAMVATPDGKLWIGSAPNYGIRGGPLGWYDPKTATRGFHREVLADTSPNCLLYLPELKQLLIGLGTEPGSGVSVQRPAGAFALWDTINDQLVHAGDFGLKDIADICSFVPAGRDGLIYALSARPHYIVKDYGAQPAPMLVALIEPMPTFST